MDNLQRSSKKAYALIVRNLCVYYDQFLAVKNINLNIERNKITAIIGSSGCGKSTLIRSFNRMNDLIPNTHTTGSIIFEEIDILKETIKPVKIRGRIGMVFQKPNPFPKSIYDNIAWGLRINGLNGNLDNLVFRALKQAALFEDVKDKLDHSALSLTIGQQQRLCIARTIAVKPEIILMDEPASALDPIATLRIEDLMLDLAKDYTIIIVTHNMQQAARISDYTAFINMDEDQAGYLVEYGKTKQLFTNPRNQITEDYITGRFG